MRGHSIKSSIRRRHLGGVTALIAVANFLFVGGVEAACSGSIGSGTSVIGRTLYDPFSATGVSDQYPITVTNMGSTSCVFAIVFSATSTPAKLGAKLSYDLTNANGYTVLFPAPVGTPVRTIQSAPIAPNSSVSLPFNVLIAAGQLAGPGDYVDNVNVTAQLFSFDGGVYTLLNTVPVVIKYSVLQSLSVNIAGSGVATTLDFGVLTQGTQKNVQIQARSNLAYHLNISSDNQGKLVLTPAIAGQTWAVPYLATLDATALDLNGIVNTNTSGQTTLLGDNHTFSVSIGDVSKKRAGLYRDVITIRIVPN
jgi:hypothetical protein